MEDFNLVLLHKEKAFRYTVTRRPVSRTGHSPSELPVSRHSPGLPALRFDQKNSGGSRSEYHGSNLKLPRLSGHTAAVYHNKKTIASTFLKKTKKFLYGCFHEKPGNRKDPPEAQITLADSMPRPRHSATPKASFSESRFPRMSPRYVAPSFIPAALTD